MTTRKAVSLWLALLVLSVGVWAQGRRIEPGLFSVLGFGTSEFVSGGTGTNRISVRNTTAGTANQAAVTVGNDASAGVGWFFANSTTYTPSGVEVADGVHFTGTRAGGITIAATHASGTVRLYAGGSTTTSLLLGTAGTVVGERQHYISCYNDADDTGQASGATVDCNQEVDDDAGRLASDTFTAQVAGWYLLTATVTVTNEEAQESDMYMAFEIDGVTYRGGGAYPGASVTLPLSGTAVVYMDANDTAVVKVYSGGSFTVEGGTGTDQSTWWQVRLMV